MPNLLARTQVMLYGVAQLGDIPEECPEGAGETTMGVGEGAVGPRQGAASAAVVADQCLGWAKGSGPRWLDGSVR